MNVKREEFKAAILEVEENSQKEQAGHLIAFEDTKRLKQTFKNFLEIEK